MKEIRLTKGQVALVDDEDFGYLNQWKWCSSYEPRISNYYAFRREYVSYRKQETIKMHRLIMSTPNGMEVDHINGNTLDNRKSNLRNCSHAENIRNREVSKRNKSGYKGVSVSSSGKWWARIRIDGAPQLYLGTFTTPEDAARAYDKKALELFGEFAKLNFPPMN